MTESFRAWRVHQEGERFAGRVEEQTLADLPDGEVTIAVSHSSLNYKDALSASGNRGVTREFPHTPGIDAAGEVVESRHPDWQPGQAVIVTGYDLGMNTPGGFGERIRVPADWCVAMPAGWDGRTAMVYGTAGLTAGLCVDRLLAAGISPEAGPVVVTGASGGVGSLAIELLRGRGFQVEAVSGKPDHESRLKALGAGQVLPRDTLEGQKRPLLKPRWQAAVDTLGSEPLAELLKQIQPGGAVSACGLAAGPALNTTVMPFILRGVSLLGVDSVEIPRERKADIWKRLASDWRCPLNEEQAVTIGMADLPQALDRFLQGEGSGRVVLEHDQY